MVGVRTTEELLWQLNDVEHKFAPAELFFAGDVSLLRTERYGAEVLEDEESVDLLCAELPESRRESSAEVPF